MEFNDDDAGWEEPVEEEAAASDPAVERAKPRILELFDPAPGPLLYQAQIAIKLERDFFHWVTIRALKELVGMGELQTESMPLELDVAQQHVMVRFYRRRSYRNWRREAEAKLELIRSYSSGPLAAGLGPQGEMMFDAGLGGAGFRVLARDVRSFEGREWNESGHDLDRVYERDGVRYGAEIKNTLSYIERHEFDIKIRMCRHLGVRPLFIACMLPKSYIDTIVRSGGFALVFGFQLYPHGYRQHAEVIRRVLGLPADSPVRLQDGTIKRFVDWHERNLVRNSGGYP